MTDQIPHLDCSACHGKGSMDPTSVGRFSPAVQAIGIILLMPSFATIILGASCVMCSPSMIDADRLQRLPHESVAAETVAQGLAGVLSCGTGTLIVITGLVGGLLGWILVMRRKVWRCRQCGFILDRV